MTRLFAGTPWDQPPPCPRCDRPEGECQCSAAEKAKHESDAVLASQRRPPGKQSARVTTEKRKGGRWVTIVSGLSEPATDLAELQKDLQSHCGVGGSLDKPASQIMLQGDQTDAARERLRAIGYRVR